MRASHDCETFARVSHDSREIFVRASHDSRETFVRVSHDVRAKFNQFYFSQLSLEMVLFMSHICRIVQIAVTSSGCVCERLRRVGERFATYAMTWRRFCDDFCREPCATSSRCMRGLFDTMRTLRDSSRRFCESIRKPIANSSHPSEIGLITQLCFCLIISMSTRMREGICSTLFPHFQKFTQY